MAVLPIITPENPILRKKARRVTEFKDAKFQRLVDDMIDTMHDAVGVGLAAPQVAASIRLIVVQLPDDEDSKEEYGADAGVLYVVANPEIIRHSREIVEGVEACLSIPGYFGEVDRYEGITIKGQDRHGKEFRLKTRDWLARVFQHEIDHLDGILYIDEGRAKKIWKATAADGNPDEIQDENDLPEEAVEVTSAEVQAEIQHQD